MVKIIAHRGASGLVEHENTLESFEKAIEIGADMVEFDVRQTKDGILVVSHDKNFADTPVSWQTYEDMEKEAKIRGFHIPQLKEVLKMCHGNIFMDIEVKEHGFEKKLLKTLAKYADKDEYSIKSFNDKVPYTIKTRDPEIVVGLLIGTSKANIKRRVNELFPVRRLKKCKADFISPHYELLHFGFIRRMKKAGYPVFVWTVNEEKQIKKLLKKDIDGLITDRPDIAIEYSKQIFKL
ncbi:MAG: glycerophosphodiester phosphodiesterase [Eubacterium sp.]|nr:glycerophosphodiester phosphodiesterase [Eubacterium sp.]